MMKRNKELAATLGILNDELQTYKQQSPFRRLALSLGLAVTAAVGGWLYGASGTSPENEEELVAEVIPLAQGLVETAIRSGEYAVDRELLEQANTNLHHQINTASSIYGTLEDPQDAAEVQQALINFIRDAGGHLGVSTGNGSIAPCMASAENLARLTGMRGENPRYVFTIERVIYPICEATGVRSGEILMLHAE